MSRGCSIGGCRAFEEPKPGEHARICSSHRERVRDRDALAELDRLVLEQKRSSLSPADWAAAYSAAWARVRDSIDG